MSDEQAGAAAGGADDWSEAAEGQAQGTEEPVAQARIDELKPDTAARNSGPVELDSVLDIPVTLSVEIGQIGLSIRSLLQLNQGSVVELDRLAGEPLDVLVNGTLVAHGEVVVVNEKFGIRLTDVVSAHERVKKLA
jgi:flagellar motor switch protein FliN/FliY